MSSAPSDVNCHGPIQYCKCPCFVKNVCSRGFVALVMLLTENSLLEHNWKNKFSARERYSAIESIVYNFIIFSFLLNPYCIFFLSEGLGRKYTFFYLQCVQNKKYVKRYMTEPVIGCYW